MRPLPGIVVACLIGLWPSAAAAATRTVLMYPSRPRAILAGYEIALTPELDVAGDTVVLDLMLQPLRGGKGRNLLEPRGRWHGMEPFFFAARDMRHGAAGSTYGVERRIPVAGTSSVLRAIVVEAHLGARGSWSGGRLALRVSLLPNGT